MDGQAQLPIIDRGIETGLHAVVAIAGYYRIPADPAFLKRELALHSDSAEPEDLIRAAQLLGLKARVVCAPRPERLAAVPVHAIMQDKAGQFYVLTAHKNDQLVLLDLQNRDHLKDLAAEAVRARGKVFVTFGALKVAALAKRRLRRSAVAVSLNAVIRSLTCRRAKPELLGPM